MRNNSNGLWVVITAALVIVAFALGWWARGDVEAHGQQVVVVEGEPLPPPPCGDTWTVTAGDTLWSIASRCYPGEHTGQRAHEIATLNGVDAGRLHVGQRLVLPERGR